ncbi:hypothetical protein EVAR_65270_1 [Eumeta japonica]|uniref:Glycosyltransferase family 92 protein n=1 Tax=Eumeta variegata TaxID=151549 RepID=A0A4C1ZCI9_EUMVA|nr:hypothetical protein EVAR_65270_1 [Eumeta japonica]
MRKVNDASRKLSSNETLYCQTRPQNVQDTSIEVVAAKPIEIWWHKWDPSSEDVETPLLLSCPLTEPLLGPSIVSVVTQPCNDPFNAFLLTPYGDTKHKKNFTVCVKDMNFEKDISENLVEWIETNKLLGADGIDMYVEKVKENVEEVIEYYRKTNFVRLFQIPIGSNNRSLWQRRRDHLISYNDCLYRNIHETKFVIPLDIDEIILPKIAHNWSELIKRLEKTDWDPSRDSAILIQNVFFFDFMQSLYKYNHTNVQPHKTKIYIKRDDVRLGNAKRAEFLGYNSVNSSEDTVSNEIMDVDIAPESVTTDKRSQGCGKDVSVPRSVRHVVRSAAVSPVGHYTKSLMLTQLVLTAFNHYPLASRGGLTFAAWTAPFSEVQLNHYKESCNTTVMDDCGRYERRAIVDTAALRMRRQLLRALAKVRCAQNKT